MTELRKKMWLNLTGFCAYYYYSIENPGRNWQLEFCWELVDDKNLSRETKWLNDPTLVPFQEKA